MRPVEFVRRLWRAFIWDGRPGDEGQSGQFRPRHAGPRRRYRKRRS